MPEAGSAPDEREGGTRAATALVRLTEVSRALTYAVSLDEVLGITVECALDLLGASRAVLMLEEDDGLLRVRAARGVPAELVDQFREPLDETLVSRLDSVLGPDARKGFLGVPLVVRGEVIGLLAVLRGDRTAPSERDEWLLSALADQASVAVSNARGEDGRQVPEPPPAVPEPSTFDKDDALRMVTHDLRSPLSALQGYLHLLGAELYGPLTEAQRTALGRLEAVSRHLEGLVSNVVEMGRLAAGELTLECGPVEVAAVAGDAVTMVDLDAREHGVEIVVEVPDGLRARANTGRLRQVLVQLLENAVRYAPENSQITLTARAADGGGGGGGVVEVRVIDQGPGIPADQAEAIFQPYHRLDPGTRGKGGLGLGLAIARALVWLMDGNLEVDPEVASGAGFVLELPAV